MYVTLCISQNGPECELPKPHWPVASPFSSYMDGTGVVWLVHLTYIGSTRDKLHKYVPR